MNKDIIEGKWNEIKGQVKQKWGKITDNDITQMKGSYQELTGHIQKAYGYQKDQAEKEVNSFIEDNGWDNNDDL
jgi:uncharacterized protein YjbJ (UPF0337 family)